MAFAKTFIAKKSINRNRGSAGVTRLCLWTLAEDGLVKKGTSPTIRPLPQTTGISKVPRKNRLFVYHNGVNNPIEQERYMR